MADKLLPPEKVRVLTASKDLKPADADRHGDALFAGGRMAEAMMFYDRSKSLDRLEKVKSYAVGAGDAFLLLWVTKLAPDLVDELEWREAGEKAMAAEKYTFAHDCFERAGDADRAQAARQKYLAIFTSNPGSGRPGS